MQSSSENLIISELNFVLDWMKKERPEKSLADEYVYVYLKYYILTYSQHLTCTDA